MERHRYSDAIRGRTHSDFHSIAFRKPVSSFLPESHCNWCDETPYISRGFHIITRIGVGLKSLQGLLIWGQLEMTKSTSMSTVMST